MMAPPLYFERIRQRSADRWDQLERDPELAGPWHQLFKQVQSPRHVLSELLQNADDAGATEATVSLHDHHFMFAHNGEDFTEEHFASLCRFGYSNKRALHTIGFRGIGFKSTFSLGPTVELRSPTLSVSFGSRRFTEPTWVGAPAAELRTEIHVAIDDIHRERELHKNLREWLSSPVSLLFFKNVRKMRVGTTDMHWGDLGPGPVADSHWLALNDDPDQAFLLVRSNPEPFPADAMTEIRQERMITDDEADFPPCVVDLVLGAPGRLYVVLPTGVKTDLPFACNAPFIQDPARLKIKDTETSPTNRWLLGRVGALAASTMREWLSHSHASVADRSRAYSLLPDIKEEDSSLEGACAAIVELSFAEAVAGKPFLLSDTGQLYRRDGCVRLPAGLDEIWPNVKLSDLFDEQRRSPFSKHVSDGDAGKLVRWKFLEQISKDQVIGTLKSQHLPKPESWRCLLKLWAYIAPEVTANRYYRQEKDLRIIPVQGQDVLYSVREIVRLGEKRLLQSDADWEFLAKYLVVLNPNWPRFLAEQRRFAREGQASESLVEIDAAIAVLDALGLQDASDASKILDQVASEFFEQDSPSLSASIQLAQIAAKLAATAGPSFRFVTRDKYLRALDNVVLVDHDDSLDELITDAWSASHLLHQDYYLPPGSCSPEEWRRWVTAALPGFIPLSQRRSDVWGRQRIDAELKRRGATEPPTYHFVTGSFQIDDWDFDEEHWKHWTEISNDNPKIWLRVTERILAQPEPYWVRGRAAKASQVATTGRARQIAHEPLLPAWILKLRELPCLPDTRGAPRIPSELLRRTPSTEALMDVEPFLHGILDRESTRPLLELLGVRDVPTGPNRLLGYLRAFATAGIAPPHEVEKWYRRLDQMIDACSTSDANTIRAAFRNEKIILTEDGSWTNTLGVYVYPEDGDVPGAASIRASVRDLTLWSKVGVSEHPTADLAIEWLKLLPSGVALSPDESRRVRSLLPRHATRIWNECGHWLNLAGEWAPLRNLKYALTMQSLVAWSHLYDWAKKATADLQRLPGELTDTATFKSIPILAEQIEERLEEGLQVDAAPTQPAWLNQLGLELARIALDDVFEQERVRAMGRELAHSRWQPVQALEIVPYIDGTPAGTPRQAEVVWLHRVLYIKNRPSAKLARNVSHELGRAFRRVEIADAIKLCFERSPQFVTDYMEENFELAELQLVLDRAQDDPAAPVSESADAPLDDHNEADAGVEADDPSAASGSVVIEEQIDAAPHTDPEELDQSTRKDRRQPKPTRLSIMERFARSRGFQIDGPERYFHPNGSWISKANGNAFPWERRTAQGDIVCHYWPKDHCLDREPLQLEADLWSLIDRFPDRYALVLADADGNPVEICGARLRAMHDAGELTLYPASYRLVVDHDRKQ